MNDPGQEAPIEVQIDALAEQTIAQTLGHEVLRRIRAGARADVLSQQIGRVTMQNQSLQHSLSQVLDDVATLQEQLHAQAKDRPEQQGDGVEEPGQEGRGDEGGDGEAAARDAGGDAAGTDPAAFA